MKIKTQPRLLMAQFQYNAVNQGGKRLSGLISANNEEEARQELNGLGISILSIQLVAVSQEQSQTKEATTTQELPRFEFEASDPHGRKVIGTIPAVSKEKAYMRLIEEYNFSVAYLVPKGASEEEKTAARKEDLSALLQKNTPIPNGISANDEAFEVRRKALIERVNFILEKIKNILQLFDEEIRPERKKLIQEAMDKLLRIKNSTNLDYIQHHSELLLKAIQDQELFLHQEKMEKERSKVKFASQALLADLHSNPEPKKDLGDDLEKIHDRFAQSESRFIQGLGHFLEPYLASPEEKQLKEEIKRAKNQVWEYRKLWIKSPMETKEDAKMALDDAIKKETQLQAELKAVKRQRKALKNKEDGSHEPLITEELTQLIGFVLSFYLILYFASFYQVTKGFLESIPFFEGEELLASHWMKSFLLSIFLWYLVLSFRLIYLRYKSWANLVMLPIGLIANAVVLFNV